MRTSHGIKLKSKRLSSGMTQKELAEKAGVSLRMVQYYEQGYKDILRAEAQTVQRLADALECKAADILD